MKTLATLVIFVAVISAAEARTITVSEFNDSAVFTQENATYRVLSVEQVNGEDKTSTVYIVENVSAIDRYGQQLAALGDEGARLETEQSRVLDLTAGALALKRENEAALGTLAKQQVYYQDVLGSLEAERNDTEQKIQGLEGRHAQLTAHEQELTGRLTSNVVLSPTNYGISLLVFIMLIAGAIVFQRKEIPLLRFRKRHKGAVSLPAGEEKQE